MGKAWQAGWSQGSLLVCCQRGNVWHVTRGWGSSCMEPPATRAQRCALPLDLPSYRAFPRFMQVTAWCCGSREVPLALSQTPVTSGAKGSREFVAFPSWLLEVEPYGRKPHAIHPGQLRNFKFKAKIKGKKEGEEKISFIFSLILFYF